MDIAYIEPMQSFVKTTPAILAYKALNRNIDKFWIDWAVDILMHGFDTEHLVILAGISPPYDQFELQSLTEKVLAELQLSYSDKNKVIDGYIRYLIQCGTDENLNIVSALSILKELKDFYYELGCDDKLSIFFALYWGANDLQEAEVQWYVDGMDRGNVLSIVKEEFARWLNENPN